MYIKCFNEDFIYFVRIDFISKLVLREIIYSLI